jgi:hypothetical protein
MEQEEFIQTIQKPLTYLYEGEVNFENTVELLEFFNSSADHIDLYFTTEGGIISYLYPMINAIEGYKDITIHPIQYCSSAGFLLLLNTTCKLSFPDKSIISVVHYPRIDSLKDFNKNNIYNQQFFLNKRHEMEFNQQLEQLPLPTKTINALKKGKDVELYHDDLINIFKDRL